MITIRDVHDAQSRIKDHVFRTPTFLNRPLSKKMEAEVYIKLECYQPTGVFKIRGAFSIILDNMEEAKRAGVVTASSGNHGLSLAYAAKSLGVKCTVVVTKNANPDKVRMIRQHEAQVVEGGATSDAIISQARELAASKGLFFVHPFDDPAVIAGQGTSALELLEDVQNLDSVLVPVGGGGLISGTAAVFRAIAPECKIIGVEPTGVPSLYESLKKGELVTIKDPKSIADGLIGQTIGKLNFEILRQSVRDVVLVSDDEMKDAVKELLFDSHLLVEPSGAAPVAALLSGAYKPNVGERTALILSGGNISYLLLRDLLNESLGNNNNHNK